MLNDNATGCTSCRLLLIDNDSARRASLAGLLEKMGYPVTAVINQQIALEQIQGQEFDLVLLDAKTAQSGQYTLFAGLRSDVNRAGIPVVVMAGADEQSGVEACLAMGAVDYFLAPYVMSLLRVRIDASLETWQARQESLTHLEDEARIKLQHDIQVARRIQAGFLPKELPQLEGWEIAARFHPAREVAGDWYDAFMLSQNRRLGFVIGDVVDKGVPAALFMALVRSMTRAFAQQNYSLSWTNALEEGSAGHPRGDKKSGRSIPSTGSVALKNAVLLTNNYVVDNHSEDNMFCTLFFGMLDPVSGQLAYINGGHNPPFIVAPDGHIKAVLRPSGPAVGMFPATDFRTDFGQLDPGDILYAYTDGVTEAKNPQGKLYTEARLKTLLSRPETSAGGLLDHVEAALQEFMADAVQFDDITMMAIRRKLPSSL